MTPEEAERFYEGVREDHAALRRQETEPYYNPSLAGAISQYLGPGYQSAYEPRLKHFIRTPGEVNRRGVYIVPEATPEQLANQKESYPFRGQVVEGRTSFVPQADHVYHYGVEPSARTFAHEFRHRGGVDSEYRNRLYDAMYSRTEEDWADAVFMFHNYITQIGGSKATLEEAEEILLDRINPSFWGNPTRTDMLRDEYRRAPENDKPPVQNLTPSLGGFLASLLQDDEAEFVTQSVLPYELLMKKRKEKKP